MATYKRYDDKFRASAVVMLQAAGYPETKGALQRVADTLHIQPRVLRRWFNGEINPPPDDIVSEKAADLKTLLEAELSLVFTTMSSARSDASYRDLAVAVGIMIDKLQLLNGGVTGRNEVIVKAYETFSPDDWDKTT